MSRVVGRADNGKQRPSVLTSAGPRFPRFTTWTGRRMTMSDYVTTVEGATRVSGEAPELGGGAGWALSSHSGVRGGLIGVWPV